MSVLMTKVQKDGGPGPESINSVFYGFTNNNPTPVYVVTHTYTSSDDYWFQVGYNIDQYHARKKRGELIPMTPWRQGRRYGSATGDHWVKSYNTGSNWSVTYLETGQYLPSESWLITDDEVAAYAPDTYDEYVAEAAAKIYNTGHDTLTFIAELADVKRLFAGTARRLIRMSPPKNISEVTSEWLSARYGWRTLMYDIESLNEAIRNLNDKRTRYSKRAGTTYSFTNSDEWTTNHSSFIRQHTLIDEVTIGIRGSVVADIEISKFQLNPLQTGWEIIPFSFVIDWFVNVGKTLSAWSFLATQTDYTAAAGYIVEVEREYQFEIESGLSNFISGHSYMQGSCYQSQTRRTPCSIPKLPHLILKLNSFKILDLLALIIQRWR